MIIPPLQGKLTPAKFTIYTACDTNYFDDFALELINSIQSNTTANIHLHIFNPRDDQLDFCLKHISTTWEYVTEDLFSLAEHRLLKATEKQQQSTLTAMKKSNDLTVRERMKKTYFACARFIRLAEIFNRTVPMFSIDVDAVVRKEIPSMPEHDFYLHYISGKKARHLAGGLYLNPTPSTENFLREYAALLKTSIERDFLYWGLDQDVLDQVVPKYNSGQLPMSFIDWNMSPDSCIWTAKGARKELVEFKDEQAKYKG